MSVTSGPSWREFEKLHLGPSPQLSSTFSLQEYRHPEGTKLLGHCQFPYDGHVRNGQFICFLIEES